MEGGASVWNMRASLQEENPIETTLSGSSQTDGRGRDDKRAESEPGISRLSPPSYRRRTSRVGGGSGGGGGGKGHRRTRSEGVSTIGKGEASFTRGQGEGGERVEKRAANEGKTIDAFGRLARVYRQKTKN